MSSAQSRESQFRTAPNVRSTDRCNTVYGLASIGRWLDCGAGWLAGWLARTYPGEQALQVSTETICRSLFVQARAGIVDAVSIRERPAEVEDRAVPGHWGGLLAAHKRFSVASDVAV